MSRFHVFLSHKGSDKPTVRALKQALTEHGLKSWLDEEQLRPRLPWQNLLEQGIENSGSVAVCVTADGLGLWEMEGFNPYSSAANVVCGAVAASVTTDAGVTMTEPC